MAIVKYKDCSGADKSVDKESTFEICATDPNSFEYNPSLWRVEEVGSCEEVKPACNKYRITRERGGIDRSTILLVECESGTPKKAVLKAKKNSIIEICSQKEPMWAKASLLEGLVKIEKIGVCGADEEQVNEDAPVPANRYYQLTPCNSSNVVVYTKREPALDNERVSISNPQDVGVPSNVNWTYNGQTTNADNPGVLAASIFSKNVSGCTDTQEDILDGGLDRPKPNPYSIRIGVSQAGIQAKLSIDGTERTVSSNNLFVISNFNPTSSSDTRRVPSISYSVGDLVQGTDSKGLVRDYIISNISETYSNGTERRTNNLNQGDRFKYVGQNVSFDILYNFYLELAENVQEDTTPPSPPVTGGPDGNTNNVTRTGNNNSSQNETVFQPR
jgi:hypothetical protein